MTFEPNYFHDDSLEGLEEFGIQNKDPETFDGGVSTKLLDEDAFEKYLEKKVKRVRRK
jgi:hypothetical protein|tara:strand:+ start:306 stop:479 length:174 start_codon:yes stop_codon:yes gene_type:complete